MTSAEILTHIKRLTKISGTAEDAFLIQEMDNAQKDFNRDVNLPHKETKKSLAAVAYKHNYPLPKDVDTITGITYQQKHYLRPVNRDTFLRLSENESYGIPRYYFIEGGTEENLNFKIWPSTDSDSPTTTLASSISSTQTTIQLTSPSGLEEKGRGMVESLRSGSVEIVAWQYLSGSITSIVSRGLEETNGTITLGKGYNEIVNNNEAIAHNSGVAFAYNEFEVSCYKTLTDISSTATAPEIPGRYHEALIMYPAARYHYKEEERNRGNEYMKEYEKIKFQAKEDLGEKSAQKFSTTLDDTNPTLTPKEMDETIPDRSSIS